MKEQKFSERLKEARLRKGWSQVELARRIKVSDGAVGNWEADVNPPGPSNLRKLADALSVSIEYLRGTPGHYRINDSPENPSPDTLETQIRTKCHQYLDQVMDSFRGDEDRLRWLVVELREQFPIIASPDQQPSSVELSGDVEQAMRGAPEAIRLARESSPKQKAGEPSGGKHGQGGGAAGH